MFRLTFAIAITHFATASLFLQEPIPKETGRTCSFSEIYKAEGWTIPGLMNAKVKRKANFTNLPGVTVTILEPVKAETTITTIHCARNDDARLEIGEAPIRVLELSAYEYNGRVFAYGVSYEMQSYDEGLRVALGCASGVLFYDSDGSGKFTVRKGATWPFIPELPPNLTKGTEPTPPPAKPIIH